MDKNKNRTDLLAAGRKKLQQFRQKKDNKGNNNKSLGKVGKSGHDASVSASSKGVATAQELADEERSVPLSEDAVALSHSEMDSATTDAVAATGEESATSDVVAIKALAAGPVEVPMEDSGVAENRLNTSGDSSHDTEMSIRNDSECTSSVPEDLQHNLSETSNLVPQKKSVESSISSRIGISSQLEMQHGEEQVTDAKQEAGSSGLNHPDTGAVKQLQGESQLSSGEFSKTAGGDIICHTAPVEPHRVASEATPINEINDASSSAVSIDDAGEAQGRVTNSHDLPVHSEETTSQGENSLSGLTGEEKIKMPSASNDNDGKTEHTQVTLDVIDAKESFEVKTDDTRKSLEHKMVDLSPGSDGSLISLSRLAEILQGLDVDELRFLFMSSQTASQNSSNIDSVQMHESGIADTLEELKDQLYLTSFARDVFHMQISEHQHLAGEISLADASLSEVRGKNEVLAKDLAKCKCELTDVISNGEELRQQLHFSQDQVVELSAKVNELQNKLELTQGNLSSLTSELAECTNLVASLKAENEHLRGSSDLRTEENKKILEDNERIMLENEQMAKELALHEASLESLRLENVELKENLALLREARRKLEEGAILEHNKYLADLADYKSKVEALQGENKNLNEILTSVPEERKKLQDEKEFLAQETGILSKELMDSNDLAVALQVEISILNGVLTSIMEDGNKLERERNKIFCEYEKQSHEMDELKELLVGMQAKYGKAVSDGSSEFPVSGRRQILMPTLEVLCSDVYSHSSGFLLLKKHLEDAGNLTEKLEISIEEMHLSSNSLSRSGGKMVAPGVSKLIQAFESKTHTDDNNSDESPSEDQRVGDEYMVTKRTLQDLRALVKELILNVEDASEFRRCIEDNKLRADAASADCDYKSLKEHSNQLEEAILEHMILYEATKEHICQVVVKGDEVTGLCDSLQKENVNLKEENSRLREKLDNFLARISELQSQLGETYRHFEDMMASFSSQLNTLEEGLVDRESRLEGELTSHFARVHQSIGKLDATIKPFFSRPSLAGMENLDVSSLVAISVDAAIKAVEGLHGQLEATKKAQETISEAHNNLDEKLNNLQRKNEMANNILHNVYDDLCKLVSDASGHPKEIVNSNPNEELLDLSYPGVFGTPLDQLKNFLAERVELQTANDELNSELRDRAKDINELEKRRLQLDIILKLVEDIERLVRLEESDISSDPASRLESLIYLLLQKYEETAECLVLSNKKNASMEEQSSLLREQIEYLDCVFVQYQNENLVFKQSLKSAEENIVTLSSRLQEKVAELEQSEQRVSSLREKLSIAVTKGKGLISQRDSLKQSLAETSKELEKCSQELLSKDTRIQELEINLKAYSEAGERMESLESELSYIRNSATALRESFLLKDSVLQRIEEILEELELPENFHSRDIIEKIDWLAKSFTGNSMPLAESDQRNLVGGEPYPDSGFLDVDGLQDDMQRGSNSGDELRTRFEELQSKFYGLAEQNEMLEQSLMERNNLVHQWEEILSTLDMPLHLRSMEPDEKIQWLGTALSEAQNQCSSLQHKIDNIERVSESVNADLEEAHKRISELDTDFQQVSRQNASLSKDLQILTHDYDQISKKTAQFEMENGNLQNEISLLQAKLELKLKVEEDMRHIEGAIRRAHDLVKDVLQDSAADSVAFEQDGSESFEELLTKLLEKYKMLSLEKPVNIVGGDANINEIGELSSTSREANELDAVLHQKLEDSMGELISLKAERESLTQTNEALLHEIEALQLKRNELQELLNQEEHKSASLREKLNVAVRKGKSLVQQRDGMKQVIDQLNAEVEHLKSHIKLKERAISEYEQRVKDFSSDLEKLQVLESENVFLRDRLAETESHLQDKEGSLSMILNTLADIDIGVALTSDSPSQKLKEIGKRCHDLQTTISAAEQESRKSKRAAELLLAELNEVQERNDSLQEELTKAADELSYLSQEKSLAEAAKHETLAHIENLSAIHLEEKDRLRSEVMLLKSGMDQLREELFVIDSLMGDVLSKDLEMLRNAEACMKSFLEPGQVPDMSDLLAGGSPGDAISVKLENKVFIAEMDSIREQLHNHSRYLSEEVRRLSEVARDVHREISSQKQTYESMRNEVKQLESMEKKKDSELVAMHRNIDLLYEACNSALVDLENLKTYLAGNGFPSGEPPTKLKPEISVGGNNLTNDPSKFTEEGISDLRDKLLMVVKDFMRMQSEKMEFNQREMKLTILNLQKEIQEKDIQRERICMELVNQIKAAEANAKNYWEELQSAQNQILDLQRQVDLKEDELKLLEERLKELHQQNMGDLQQKVTSLTSALAAKEQETEALLQALDEEETQLEDLTNKIEKLEQELQQKKQDLENLEVSRGKALKKLSITVSKFDELHYLSESLLAEVEKLQSQVQERDEEISFLRQEVTRCTNDALAVTQMSKKKNSDEIQGLLTWLDSLISQVTVHDETFDDTQVEEHKERLQKQIAALVADLENHRVVSQKTDLLLQAERSKVEELTQKERYLEDSLREKESQLNILRGAGNSGQDSNTTSEIMEVDQVTNKWTAHTTIAPQVRSLRKTNNDQVAIAIDMDPTTSEALEEEDDDKAHGFKSLTTSRFVPRFTRPITDMVDGLWMSCDRALMRQPAFRLGVIFYWAILHALLASFAI